MARAAASYRSNRRAAGNRAPCWERANQVAHLPARQKLAAQEVEAMNRARVAASQVPGASLRSICTAMAEAGNKLFKARKTRIHELGIR